jgi:hypothetical protein
MVVGDGRAHRNLAIILVAKLAAVLPRDADRVLALLRKTCVVDDPVSHRPVPLEGGQHRTPQSSQQRRVIPIGLGYNVMERLVTGLYVSRLDPGRHGLHALASARQQQSRTVGAHRRSPAGMTQHRGDLTQVGCKPRLAVLKARSPFHLFRHGPRMGRPTATDTVKIKGPVRCQGDHTPLSWHAQVCDWSPQSQTDATEPAGTSRAQKATLPGRRSA